MKARFPFLLVVCSLVGLCGCASVGSDYEKVRVSAVLVDPESLILVGFSEIGYSEQQVLVRVTAPQAMKDEVLALRFSVAWGKKVTTYGDLTKWQRPIGSTVQFTVRRKDITNEWPRENRRIYANRLREVLWPNQPPEPTVMSVPPPAGAGAAPATTVAHL